MHLLTKPTLDCNFSLTPTIIKKIKEKMELPRTLNLNNNVFRDFFFLPISVELLPARLES